MLIIAFLQFWIKDHREPCYSGECLSLAKKLVGIELGTFQLCSDCNSLTNKATLPYILYTLPNFLHSPIIKTFRGSLPSKIREQGGARVHTMWINFCDKCSFRKHSRNIVETNSITWSQFSFEGKQLKSKYQNQKLVESEVRSLMEQD